jgi:NUDE protein, C-terminal conserved region
MDWRDLQNICGLVLTLLLQTKFMNSKTEANKAQDTLQKEITTLRNSSRDLQMKLRDIEVSNDDIEKQARNTHSSLEDLEKKYDVAIERGVMMEEEIRNGDQERETLRIETQRLRDQLGDLKVEADITAEKLRNAEVALELSHERHHISTGPEPPHSPVSETSPATTTSSPIVGNHGPSKSIASSTSSAATPPSPPASDSSATMASSKHITPVPKSRLLKLDQSATPRGPYSVNSRLPRHSRGPSTTADRPTPSRGVPRTSAFGRNISSSSTAQTPSVAPSQSLKHIRGLRTQMERLEQRVQLVRSSHLVRGSKLPGPVNSPPRSRVSPRAHNPILDSGNVTVRSRKSRTGSSVYSSEASHDDESPSHQRRVSRLSFGVPGAGSSVSGRPESRGGSRPSSRASISGRQSVNSSQSQYSQTGGIPQRPQSRASLSGARTPLGNYAENPAGQRRPRSSLGGSMHSSQSGHSHSASVSGIEEIEGFSTPTSRRSTLTSNGVKDLAAGSAIPTPSRRKSGQTGLANTLGGSGLAMTPGIRRTSSGPLVRDGEGGMGPPQARTRKLSEVGET